MAKGQLPNQQTNPEAYMRAVHCPYIYGYVCMHCQPRRKEKTHTLCAGLHGQWAFEYIYARYSAFQPATALVLSRSSIHGLSAPSAL
jgi:hypothetical protein